LPVDTGDDVVVAEAICSVSAKKLSTQRSGQTVYARIGTYLSYVRRVENVELEFIRKLVVKS
jgi:hypothetical protein